MLVTSQVGGCGLGLDETLIRFDKTPGWANELLHGRLSLTNVAHHAKSDKQEATRTESDKKSARAFFGQLADYQMKRLDAQALRIRTDAYVNCWHRYSAAESDLPRLIQEYSDPAGGIAVTTTVYQLHTVLNQVTHLNAFLEFLAVKYVNESDSMDELLRNEPPILYPELAFKRQEPWRFEREARVVLHSGTATLVQPVPRSAAQMENSKYRSVPVDASELVTRVFLWGSMSDPVLQERIRSAGLGDKLHFQSPSAENLVA